MNQLEEKTIRVTADGVSRYSTLLLRGTPTACCYTADVPTDNPVELHICDASEKAYGAVAYMSFEDDKGRIQVAFVMARSSVAPKKQLSISRLELCAILSGAQ